MTKPNEHGHDKEIAHNTAQTNTKLDEVIRQLQQLNVKEDKVMANLDEVLAAVAAIEGDTANVERVIGEVSAQITALQAQVADLQAQLAAGTAITAEQAQGILDRLNVADAAFDSLAPDAP